MFQKLEEGYWRIASVLANAVRDQQYRSLLISGTARGDGATTVTLQAASRLVAKYNIRPLVVELDFWRPRFVKKFRLNKERTIDSVFGGRLCIGEIVQDTSAGFPVVAAAARRSPPKGDITPLLGRIITELGPQADIVLVDTPPLLTHAAMLTVGSVVPRMILVVRAGRTSSEVVSRVQREAKNVNIELIGTVLNKHRRYMPGWLYRYFKR